MDNDEVHTVRISIRERKQDRTSYNIEFTRQKQHHRTIAIYLNESNAPTVVPLSVCCAEGAIRAERLLATLSDVPRGMGTLHVPVCPRVREGTRVAFETSCKTDTISGLS